MATDVMVTLPRPHPGQLRVTKEAKRFNVLECGRRFGKTTLGLSLCAETSLKGEPCAWFAPTYRTMSEQWRDLSDILAGVIESQSKMDQQIRLYGGGVIDFWSMDNPDSGRGRKYKLIIVDEASVVRDLKTAWENTVRPTLTDLKGGAWFLGTPKGRNYFHQLFSKGQQEVEDWKSWRLPTASNPYMDSDEIGAAKRDLPERVFTQEYEGIPDDDAGNPFGYEAIQECLGKMSTGPAVVYGVDLAKYQDWTVVIGLDNNGRVCTCKRWQIDWKQTKDRIRQMTAGQPVWIDSTGVGDPIAEDLARGNPAVHGYTFTGRSKQQLMEGLAGMIQREEIGLPESEPWLIHELESFQYEYTMGGGVKYSAPEGMHDDGVCALALAARGLVTIKTEPDIRVRMIAVGDDDYDDDDRMWTRR